MNKIEKKRNRLLGKKVRKGLGLRQMDAYFAETKEAALKKALSLIEEGSQVGWGGSKSAEQIGLIAAIKEGNYSVLDRHSGETAEETAEITRKIFFSDYFICGANAITEDGILVNIDGQSNRVAALCYGPKNVIVIVGMNKVCPDVQSAFSRARHHAAPINATRFGMQTPCCSTGSCGDCLSPDTICCNFLMTRFSREKGRIKVILVNEELGY